MSIMQHVEACGVVLEIISVTHIRQANRMPGARLLRVEMTKEEASWSLPPAKTERGLEDPPCPGEDGSFAAEAAGSAPPGLGVEEPPAHSDSLASTWGTSASRRRREFMSTASCDSTCRRASVEIWVVWFHLQRTGDLH